MLCGLREIGVLLKRQGLTPTQCVIGFRIIKMFADQGVDGETCEHFISDVYKECVRRGITPRNIVAHIEDLIKFSNDARLPEIEGYMNVTILQEKELERKDSVGMT